MENLQFSFIIPVYNRPNEIKELLESFLNLSSDFDYEIVIVEDGSTITSKAIVDTFSSQLDISYYYKPNSGPGSSRNFGMQRAKGNYFIILDSDVILPSNYITIVASFLRTSYYDYYGGPDKAHSSFTNIQKAISFAMTSFITTGGIRGGKKQIENFQPRSFNMGLSKNAFQESKGFGCIHPGEDPDLSLRLKALGYKSTLIEDAFVYHKRRISWSKFYQQVNKFGMVRPILNNWHPKSKSLIYWFPSIFCLGFIIALSALLFNIKVFLILYIIYFTLAFILAIGSSRSILIAFQAIFAILVQFFGYGYGFLKSSLYIGLLKKDPHKTFPNLFFNDGEQ